MSSSPPPFGDPSQVQSENARAIRKGIGCGCGGCFTIVAAIVALMICIIVLAFSLVRSSGAVKEAMGRAQSSPAVEKALGTPVEMGWLVNGSVNSTAEGATARVSIPLLGPKGQGTLEVDARQQSGGVWTFSVLKLTHGQPPQVIDLTQQAAEAVP